MRTSEYYAIPGYLSRQLTDFKSACLRSIGEHFGITPKQLHKSGGRIRDYVYPRQLLHYFLRNRMTLHEVANVTGHSHCSVCHSINKINGFIDVDKRVVEDVKKITAKINNISINKIEL